MIDQRFHHCEGPFSLAELCERVGHAAGIAPGFAAVTIAGASDLEGADGQSISFAAHAQYGGQLAKTGAAAVFVTEALAGHVPEGTAAIVCEDPYGVFIDALGVLYPDDTRRIAAGSSGVGEARLEPGVSVGTGAVLGPGAEIGSGTVIGANCVIGAGVTIGRDCAIGGGTVIECAHLGNGVILQPGVVIGAEGFGFQIKSDRHKKIPQLGRVIIQDRVEIGANSTVDRGTLGDTVIGEGTKIDNLVQVGHNCRIGRNCIISGMCGLSGSTVLEDGVVMGGGAASAGHLTIGAGSVIYARGAVSRSFPPGSNVAGTPAQDIRMWKREIAILRRLVKGESK